MTDAGSELLHGSDCCIYVGRGMTKPGLEIGRAPWPVDHDTPLRVVGLRVWAG